jgi:uncharacterized membrane protein
MAAPLVRHWPATLIVLAAFLVRLALADKNSYWYDEFLSILFYGSSNTSAAEALGHLARESHHPPLYQLILFYWMKAFGTGEIATRTLSNLYIAGGTAFLYALVVQTAGRRQAIAAALAMSLMYIPFYYGMETRSYAQTIFLVCVSSWAMFRVLEGLFDDPDTKIRLKSLPAAALMGANFALLMTHYSNVLFILMQAAFLLFAIVRITPRPHRSRHLWRLGAIVVLPIVLLAAIWGPVMISTAGRVQSTPVFQIVGLPRPPWTAIYTFIIKANLKPLAWLALPVLAALFFRTVLDIAKRPARALPRGFYLDIYAFAWLLLPAVLMFALFWFSGKERYVARYFAFCAPALTILIAAGMDRLVRLGETYRVVPAASPTNRGLPGFLCVLFLALALTGPGAYAAARANKENYRGLAQAALDVVARDPACGNIYEAAWRPEAMLDYYLEREGGTVRTRGTIRVSEEANKSFAFEEALPALVESGCVIVAFPHLPPGRFPEALARLRRYFPSETRLVDRKYGLHVFRTEQPAGGRQIVYDGPDEDIISTKP